MNMLIHSCLHKCKGVREGGGELRGVINVGGGVRGVIVARGGGGLKGVIIAGRRRVRGVRRDDCGLRDVIVTGDGVRGVRKSKELRQGRHCGWEWREWLGMESWAPNWLGVEI